MSTTKQESPFEVGQEVVLTNSNYSKIRSLVVVTKVGRTLVYVERGGRQVPFDKFDGVERRSIHAGGPASRIRTHAQVLDDERHSAAVDRLAALNVTNRGYGRWQYSAETLEKVAEIFQADPAAPKTKEESK